MTRNVERAKKFYSETLGWTFDGMPMPGGGTYWVAKIGDEPVAGMFDISGPDYKDTPESWMPYIAVDDVDARVKKATQGRRHGHETGLRRSRRRPHRHPARARRRRRRLDDAGGRLIR